MLKLEYRFEAELWLWSARDSWTFITLPPDAAKEIRFFHSGGGGSRPRRGFGSIRVQVTCGDSQWKTSIFPDSRSGSYVLPIKAAIRKAEGITAGDTAAFHLSVIDDPM